MAMNLRIWRTIMSDLIQILSREYIRYAFIVGLTMSICGASERDSTLVQVSPAHLATSSMRLFVPSLVVLHFNFKLLDKEIFI